MASRSTPSNPLCACRKTGAWSTEDLAVAALDRIRHNPSGDTVLGDRDPCGVYQCGEGIYHLTSGQVLKPQWVRRDRKRSARSRRIR